MHRGWMDHPAFAKEPFTECQAFEWLVSEASWAEGKTVPVNRQPVVLKRGQLSHSIRFMSEAWGWKKDKTHRFIKHLQTWKIITTENETGQLVITICNYDEYQNGATESETANTTTVRRERDRGATGARQTIKKDNTLKEIYTPVFEEAWKAYPESADMPKRNMSKADAWKKWQAAEVPEADLLRAVKSYADDLRKPKAPMPCHMATWLHQKRYEGPLAETQATVNQTEDAERITRGLTGVSAEICKALTPAVYQAWLSTADIRDGPEVEIRFKTDFARTFFQDKYALKVERETGRKINCRTGT